MTAESLPGSEPDSEDDEEELISDNPGTSAHVMPGLGTEINERCNEKCDDKYYAQLIGFGTLSAAEQFANHVTKKGFSVKVEKRRSRSAKGRIVYWYQVVTDMDADKEHLERVVDVLVNQEKLRNVRIIKSA
jgi:hypothetical protein